METEEDSADMVDPDVKPAVLPEDVEDPTEEDSVEEPNEEIDSVDVV